MTHKHVDRRPKRGAAVDFTQNSERVPITSIIFSLLVVIGLPTITFVIFGLWVAAWLAFYFLYGIKHSRLGRLPDEGAQPRQPSFRR